MKVSFYIYDAEDAIAMHDTQFYKTHNKVCLLKILPRMLN